MDSDLEWEREESEEDTHITSENNSESNSETSENSVDSNINNYTCNYFEPISTLDQIEIQLQNKRVCMIDLLHLLLPHRKYNDSDKNNNTYLDNIMQKLNDTIHETDLDAKIAYYESEMMSYEDKI
jgi:transcriptional regulator with PAS, ATPase and Fis domain